MVATGEACESIRIVGVYERRRVVFRTRLDKRFPWGVRASI
jgi:hypothetical protein